MPNIQPCRWRALLLTVLWLLLAACAPAVPQQSSATLAPLSQPLISELMAGAPGDNNHEFIELHNPGSTPYDLAGHQLVYRLATSEQDLPVYQWNRQTLIPGHGYYLLVRRGEQVAAEGDAFFDQALNDKGGGLALLSPGRLILDSLGWGDTPKKMTNGVPIPAIEPGYSLERRFTEAGDLFANQGDDVDRFDLSQQPAPQNSGARPRGPASPLNISLEAPEQVAPGSLFSLAVSLENQGEQDLTGVSVLFTIPEGFTIEEDQASVKMQDRQVEWWVGPLAAAELQEKQLKIQAPWYYLLFKLENLRVVSGTAAVFAGPNWIRVAEGEIPIRIARSLAGQEVIVQGTASMYSGGLFAGSGNTKFYLQDKSGGVQVWVPEGEGELEVNVGQELRVRGLIEPYRGTIELIAEPPTSVEVLATEVSQLEPETTTPREVIVEPERFAGELIMVEGTLTRFQEFSYSYELDLQSDSGEVLTAYVDKMTEIQVETLEVDQPYAVTGILETPDSVPTLYPRIQRDIEPIRPQALVLEIEAPANVAVGQRGQVVLLLSNYLERSVSEIDLVLAGVENGTVVEAQPEAARDGQSLRWADIELEPGETVEFHLSLAPRAGAAGLRIGEVTASEAAGKAATKLGPFDIIIGETVPISAVQGSGLRSPFVLDTLTTQGVVTAVFPSLGGLWLQANEPDDNPSTSEGLFINLGDRRTSLEPGDLVRARGRVRELSGQTQLEVTSLDDFEGLAQDQPLPEPVLLEPPVEPEAAQNYYEALEGMLVSLAQPAVAVGPTNPYGEIPLVLASHDQTRLTHANEAGHLIVLDDGASLYHNERSTLDYAVSSGDVLTGAVGPLAYTFGQYKIEPTQPPQIQTAARSRPPAYQPQPAWISVATWNVENLFDILEPHPTDPPRPRLAEYERDLAGVAATLQQLGLPELVALQEVENLEILQDLAALPALAEASYEPYLIEGTDSRGIDVAYLVRKEKIEVLEVRQLPVGEDLMSRPPLLLLVESKVPGQAGRLALINNHFTALSAGVEATRPRRLAQAELNASAAEQLLTSGQAEAVIILGDLNSFYNSPPLDRLWENGFNHALAELPGEQRYSYIYQGISQILDHLLYSPALANCLAAAEILHLNVDFPPPDLAADPLLRNSDHDPLIASFYCLGG